MACQLTGLQPWPQSQAAFLQFLQANPQTAEALQVVVNTVQKDLEASKAGSSTAAVGFTPSAAPVAAAAGGAGAAPGGLSAGLAAPMTAKEKQEAAAAANAAAAAALPSGFILLQDFNCITPRGKHDIEVGETGITFLPKSNAAGSGVLRVEAGNVTGVFNLTIQDKYKVGPAGVTHILVFTLEKDVFIGKTAHRAVAISESGAVLMKAKECSAVLKRDVTVGQLKQQDTLGGNVFKGSSLTAGNSFLLLKLLAGAVFGRIGEHDAGIFSSSSGQASIKCYSKTNEGVLFPLRRCILFGTKPLICLPHSDIKTVRVGRSGGAATRTFDLDVETLEGKVHQFSMIENEELDPLRKYVSTRTFGSGSKGDKEKEKDREGATSPAAGERSKAASAAVSPSGGAGAEGSAAAIHIKEEKEVYVVEDDAGSSSSSSSSASSAAAAGGAGAGAAAASSSRTRNMNEMESEDEAEDSEEEDSEEDSDEDSAFSGSSDSDSEEEEDAGAVAGAADSDDDSDTSDEGSSRKKTKKLSGSKRRHGGSDEDDDDEDSEDEDDENGSDNDVEMESEVEEDELKALQEEAGEEAKKALGSEGRAKRSRNK